MERTYRGKAIIVTGGTSGIGKELVLQLVAVGARVHFCGRDMVRGRSIEMQAATGTVGTVKFHKVDVTDAAAVKTLVDTVTQAEGHIDWLFHSAGIILGGEFRDHDIDDITRVLQTNVIGTATVNYYVYQRMAGQGFGHLVNLASAAGLFPVPLMGNYSASKFYVYGLTEALRLEGKGLGITVSTVAPGIIDTPIYDTGRYSRTDKGFAKTLLKNKLFSIPADVAARKILRKSARGRAIIFTQFYGRFGWTVYRLFPWLFRWSMRRSVGPYRRSLRKP